MNESDQTTARTWDGPQLRKQFTVKPGETLDSGDILIEKPKPSAGGLLVGIDTLTLDQGEINPKGQRGSLFSPAVDRDGGKARSSSHRNAADPARLKDRGPPWRFECGLIDRPQRRSAANVVF